MITPMNVPLVLRRNDNPCRVLFVVENEDESIKDMSALTARLQIRQYPGAPGDPELEALSSETTGTFLEMTAAGVEAVFAKTDIQALPVSGKAGESLALHYDLLITEGGDENAWFEGVVTEKHGVTA